MSNCRWMLLVAAFLCSSTAWAPPILPPWLALSDPNISLSLGRFQSAPAPDGRYLFRVERHLRGPAPGSELLSLRMPDTALRPPIESSVIVAHSAVRSASMKPRRVVVDESVRAVISVEGLPAAVFPITDRWSAELERTTPHTPLDETYRTTLFAGLRDEDPSWAALWAGELAVRWATLVPFSDAELVTIDVLIDRTDVPTPARAALLTNALDHRPQFGDRYVSSASRILATLAVDDVEAEAVLVHAALLVAAAHPARFETPTIERWLYSAPVLAERAALALRAQSPEAERSALDRVLLELPANSERARFLREHRGRMLDSR